MSRSSFLTIIPCVLASALHAESVHQSVSGEALFDGSGKKAVAAGLLETRAATLDGTPHAVARTTAGLPQWGFVTAWFGLPAPAGASVVRLRILADGTATTAMNAYITIDSAQVMVGSVAVPPTAKAGEMVTLDIPINATGAWNGFVLKKVEAGNRPGPWIATLSVVLP